MMLRVHKDRTDALTLVDVANDFVGGERKTKAIIWQIFRKRYPKQVLYFVKVNTNGKLETRTKGIADKCSDLTCTKKYALTEGPKRGVGKLMWATRSALPVILCLLRACTGKDLYAICSYRSLQKVGYVPLYTFSQIVVWYTATGL